MRFAYPGVVPMPFGYSAPPTTQEIATDVPRKSGGDQMWADDLSAKMWRRRPVGVVGWAKAAGWPGPTQTTLPPSRARPSPEPRTRRRYISRPPPWRSEYPNTLNSVRKRSGSAGVTAMHSRDSNLRLSFRYASSSLIAVPLRVIITGRPLGVLYSLCGLMPSAVKNVAAMSSGEMP